jgi:lysine 2,3-aminomutase
MSSDALRNVADLARVGFISEAARPELEQVASRYAVSITPEMAALIDPADPHDPIALQFVPDARELEQKAGENPDPIGDDAHAPVEGIVHRYPDRVLLKLLHVCPVYCRFCFRREMVGPGKPQSLTPDALDAAMDYIAAHDEIWEVILTGGDPLTMSARRLRDVFERLRPIAHVKIIRIHTRVPVVDPARITDALVDAMRMCGKTIYVALHANHPRELTANARAACAKLIDAGIPMLSQSVLLKGVNNNVETLAALMRAFVEMRIKPYYLHHADLAPGTAHLRTSIEEGKALIKALRGHVSGLCQPTYVLDIPGGHGKAPIDPDLAHSSGGGWRIEDFRGRTHDYDDPA